MRHFRRGLENSFDFLFSEDLTYSIDYPINIMKEGWLSFFANSFPGGKELDDACTIRLDIFFSIAIIQETVLNMI